MNFYILFAFSSCCSSGKSEIRIVLVEERWRPRDSHNKVLERWFKKYQAVSCQFLFVKKKTQKTQKFKRIKIKVLEFSDWALIDNSSILFSLLYKAAFCWLFFFFSSFNLLDFPRPLEVFTREANIRLYRDKNSFWTVSCWTYCFICHIIYFLWPSPYCLIGKTNAI